MDPDLTTGVSRFQRGYYRRHRQTYRTLARHGQRPDTLFIACADSRVLPHVITSSMPGDLFELRNVGNMVPAHGSNCDATGSALEYSLHVLNVSRIIVCGHSHCGACAALLSGKAPDALEQTKSWIEQGRDVRNWSCPRSRAANWTFRRRSRIRRPAASSRAPLSGRWSSTSFAT